MSNPTSPSSPSGRRTFLKVALAASAALVAAEWLEPVSESRGAERSGRLSPSARTIFAAIVPVMLEGAWPTGAEASVARADTLAAIEEAIAGLPPATRDELGQLFALLDFAPTRCLVAGVWSPWAEASRDSVAAFLSRWRGSRFALLASAYGALHQIVLGAWYAQPRAWPAIGYSGPPPLEARQ